MAGTSRVNGNVYARFCGRLVVKFHRPTRHVDFDRFKSGVSYRPIFESGPHNVAQRCPDVSRNPCDSGIWRGALPNVAQMARQRSLEFRAEPHTDLEPGTVVIHVVAPAAWLLSLSGASSIKLDCLQRGGGARRAAPAAAIPAGLPGPRGHSLADFKRPQLADWRDRRLSGYKRADGTKPARWARRP